MHLRCCCFHKPLLLQTIMHLRYLFPPDFYKLYQPNFYPLSDLNFSGSSIMDQQVKDLALLLLWPGFNPWPWELPHAMDTHTQIFFCCFELDIHSFLFDYRYIWLMNMVIPYTEIWRWILLVEDYNTREAIFPLS